MSVTDIVRAYHGVRLDPDNGTVLFGETVIGSFVQTSSMFTFSLMVHGMDRQPLVDQYPWVAAEAGEAVEVTILDETDEMQISALLECLHSAVDRVAGKN